MGQRLANCFPNIFLSTHWITFFSLPCCQVQAMWLSFGQWMDCNQKTLVPLPGPTHKDSHVEFSRPFPFLWLGPMSLQIPWKLSDENDTAKMERALEGGYLSTENSQCGLYINKKKKTFDVRNFPCGPEARTPHSQGRRLGFNLWPGNLNPNTATKTWHSQINK